jgi:hypothetical protein
MTLEALSFMRPQIQLEILSGNLHMDEDSGGHYQYLAPHFDGCDFAGAGEEINEIYSSHITTPTFIIEGLHSDTWGVTGLLKASEPNPVMAARTFGYALHPIQDFYSHSNWLYIVKGRLDSFYTNPNWVDSFEALTDPPLVDPYLDIWFTQPWVPLGVSPSILALHPGMTDVVFVREDGIFGAMPDDWSRIRDVYDAPDPFLPKVIWHGNDDTYLAVVSGIPGGDFFVDDQCPDGLRPTHIDLHKDASTTMTSDPNYREVPWDHRAAGALAIRQTEHEWCRILNIINTRSGAAGVAVPMGFWVDPLAPERGQGSPHPPATPCAATAPGPIEITVDVDELKLLRDPDDDDGLLTFKLVLFTKDLTRSAGSDMPGLDLDPGDVVADEWGPRPVTLCLTEQQANAAVATVQGWEDRPDDGHGLGLGDLNTGDTALLGVLREVALDDLGARPAFSEDIEVTFDIQRTTTDTDEDGIVRCDEEMLGTDPGDEDSDNDGLEDGDELSVGTDPRVADTEGDGYCDGPLSVSDTCTGGDNCPAIANPGQADYEHDGVGDACDPDADNDGIVNENDAFPNSDLSPTVVIDSCDSGVPNDYVFPNGANFSDLIGQCRATSVHHGGFVSCVSALIQGWQWSGLISHQEKASINRCAANQRLSSPPGPAPAASPHRGWSRAR